MLQDNVPTFKDMTREQKNLVVGLVKYRSTFHLCVDQNDPRYRYTGGIKYLAEAGKMPWFIRTLLACEKQLPASVFDYHEWILSFETRDEKWYLTCQDEEGVHIKTFIIGKVKFPLPGFSFHCVDGVLGLASEFGLS